MNCPSLLSPRGDVPVEQRLCLVGALATPGPIRHSRFGAGPWRLGELPRTQRPIPPEPMSGSRRYLLLIPVHKRVRAWSFKSLGINTFRRSGDRRGRKTSLSKGRCCELVRLAANSRAAAGAAPCYSSHCAFQSVFALFANMCAQRVFFPRIADCFTTVPISRRRDHLGDAKPEPLPRP
jgi:hypothetical protein